MKFEIRLFVFSFYENTLFLQPILFDKILFSIKESNFLVSLFKTPDFMQLMLDISTESGNAANQKKFDIDQLENLFDQLRAMNSFASISDPVIWQKQLRDEWE